jgi:hypothetical protein
LQSGTKGIFIRISDEGEQSLTISISKGDLPLEGIQPRMLLVRGKINKPEAFI